MWPFSNLFIFLIFQLQANVKAHQEKADKQLKDLHVQMVVKNPPKNQKKFNLARKTEKKPTPNTATVQNSLNKMHVN